MPLEIDIIIFLNLVYFLVFIPLMIRKMKKEPILKHFDSERLKKFQVHRRIGAILLVFSISFILYSWYNFDIFTGFIILAWICLLISIFVIIIAQGSINEQKKAKSKIKSILEQNRAKAILELAQEIDYPYSVLKQIVDYLIRKGELPSHSFP